MVRVERAGLLLRLSVSGGRPPARSGNSRVIETEAAFEP